MFVGSGRPLEDAARVAFKAMVRWAQRQTGMSELDAYQFVAQNSRAPIVQLVDPDVHGARETGKGAPYFTGVAGGFSFLGASRRQHVLGVHGCVTVHGPQSSAAVARWRT